MTRPALFALPGTLLDQRSLETMLSACDATTLILGDAGTLDDEVDRLAAHATGPAVWLGHSLGGIVALHLARRHPGRVAGLILLASNARAGQTGGEGRRQAQWSLAQSEGLPALATGMLAIGYGLMAAGDGDGALVGSLGAQADAVGMRRFRHQLGYARDRPGLLAPRHALACPVMALSGEFDTLCPPAHSDEIISLVRPSCRAVHHTLAGGGHLFPMQHAGWASRHAHCFLSSLQEGHG